jgi:hypothetical protein
VHQFLVVLSGSDPLVWRRIQVPEKYSFWDFHVAIQDAMGWLDYHLHEFRLLDTAERNLVSIGIPTDDDPEDRPVVPGWQVLLSKFFDQRNGHAPPALYAYDFGDDWQHVLAHEGMESADDTARIQGVSPAKAGVRRRTAVASTATPSSSKSSPIPIMRSTRRRSNGPADSSTRRRSIQSR